MTQYMVLEKRDCPNCHGKGEGREQGTIGNFSVSFPCGKCGGTGVSWQMVDLVEALEKLGIGEGHYER